MDFISEATEKGVTERRFDLEMGRELIPGILWSPEGASGGRPLILIGHGGTQHKRVPNVLGLARRMVRHQGYAALAIDAPEHGDRPGAEQRRLTPGQARRRLSDMSPEERGRLQARHAQAAQEWKVTLGAVQDLDFVDRGPVGYWGVSMGAAIGVPFVASEPRVNAAVFGLASVRRFPGSSERFEEAARSLSVPVLFLFQWDDEVAPREGGIALFDAIGSKEKTMHINPGGHLETPGFERDAAEEFFVRHLGTAKQPG